MFKVEVFLQVFGITFAITAIICHLIRVKRNEGNEE